MVAIGAAKANKRVLLIEKGHWGGDCTNFGCIPSKTLIASAKHAYSIKEGSKYGLSFDMPHLGAEGAFDHVRNVVQEVRTHEDPTALRKFGVDTLTGVTSFQNPHQIVVREKEGNLHTICADRIVIATGSHPFIPPIEGLAKTPYLTNETLFDLKRMPKKLAILGAGPIGCEMAQAFCRLGSEVVLIESERGIMTREERETQELIGQIFKKEGITIYCKCKGNSISYENNQFQICISHPDGQKEIAADQLLVATGRRPNLKELELENADVRYSERGVVVNAYGQTNQPHIFAIGDVTGGPLFTHMAESCGRAVLVSLLLPRPFKKRLNTKSPVPHCTFTDPEVAGFGMREEDAVQAYGEKSIAVYKVPMSEIDRAITSGETDGWVKVVTKKWSSQILGATIIAPRAGEMLSELLLAKSKKIPLRYFRNTIHPYPVFSRAIRKSADLWLTQTIIPLFKGKKHES